jgi:hypothetical protein
MLRFMQNGTVILFASICFMLSGITGFAQEMPSDYQEVLKSLDRKGDFKAGVLKVNIPCSTGQKGSVKAVVCEDLSEQMTVTFIWSHTTPIGWRMEGRTIQRESSLFVPIATDEHITPKMEEHLTVR